MNWMIQQWAQTVTPQQIQKTLNRRVPSLEGVETRYNGQLQRWQIEVNKVVREATQQTKRDTLRQDASSPTIDSVFEILKSLLDNALTSADFLSILGNTNARIDTFNYNKYDKGIYKQISINAVSEDVLRSMRDNWVASNVNLISKANHNQLDALMSLFRDNAYTGIRAGQLEQDINKVFRGTRKNVKLIARDQTAKLNGQLDEYKQTTAGIEWYRWRTSRNENVRPKHKAREGQLFRWDQPPEGGHPGQDYQCRCDAEPALDKVIASLK